MKTYLLFAAASIAFAGAAPVLASEATQFRIEPSAASRAEVRADALRADRAGETAARNEAYGSVDEDKLQGSRSRAEVRSESRANASRRSDYVGG